MNKIPYQERKAIYEAALEQWGSQAQTMMAVEEMSELTKEICKLFRGKGDMEALADEIADVTITLEQLRLIYDLNDKVCDHMDSKVHRLAGRLGLESQGEAAQDAAADEPPPEQMQEILFRGKRLDNGEWVVGSYTCNSELVYNPVTGHVTHHQNLKHYIIYEMQADHGPAKYAMTQVDPDTVGHYSGVEDWHGDKIFQGDILGFVNNYHGQNNRWKCVVEFLNGSYICRYVENGHLIEDYSRFDEWNVPYVKWEVIGNIYDDPELLEEGENDA